jgi:hypothetical protein
MTVTLPLFVLVAIGVFVLYRYSPVGPVAIVVIALFGFLLAGTSFAPPIHRGLASLVGLTETTASKAR